MKNMEKVVVLIKPDGVKRGLVGKIISRFEEAGFKLIATKMIRLTGSILDEWYAHHRQKPFFPSLVSFMKETPVLAMIWIGENVIGRAREICGATDPAKAAPGTIRADFGTEIQRNIIHVSDSAEAAQKEEKLIFAPEEIFKY
jgi:nucleoside-diphosphate kinase